MIKVFNLITIIIGLSSSFSCSLLKSMKMNDHKEMKLGALYEVYPIEESMTIDANWDKQEWKEIKAITIKNFMGQVPQFKPQAQAKMTYDRDYLYVIFKVNDRFVRSVIRDYNGYVSSDACVEFFFAPDAHYPLRYFNLEVNAGGTPLMSYVIPDSSGKREVNRFVEDDFKQVEIAHSLPRIVDPEIKVPLVWTVEYKVPLQLLKKYAKIDRPKRGIVWKANFYKVAAETSNPHYMTWSRVDYPKPNFHLPQFFGTLIFQ